MQFVIDDQSGEERSVQGGRDAVITLINHAAGMFRWWEEFPLGISEGLREVGIDHVIGYKRYLEHTVFPPEQRFCMHDEDQATSGRWIHRALGPIANRYGRVVIHTHSYHFPQTAMWQFTLGRRSRKWWATVHTTLRSRGGSFDTIRPLLQRCGVLFPERLFGVSDASAQALRKMFQPSSVGLLRNGRLAGRDLEAFPARSVAKTALFAGRLVPEKGIWEMLEAAAAVASLRPAFTLLIVGLGPEESRMRDWIAARQLESRIRMLGYRADMASCYAQADFVILPTQPDKCLEGLPLVALEAKGFALPVLYSLSGGLPETQIEGETGLVIDPPDPNAITLGILSLMDNAALYDRMREAIRVERRRWALEAMTRAYVNEYVREFRSA